MAHAEVEGGEIQVELVWSPQTGDVRRADLRVPRDCTLSQALQACADFQPMLGHLADFKLGIWGRQQPLSTVLRDRDRIEIYRALTVDPKEARRQRYKDRGERIVSRHRPLAGKTKRQT